jgi:hypothetical protein
VGRVLYQKASKPGINGTCTIHTKPAFYTFLSLMVKQEVVRPKKEMLSISASFLSFTVEDYFRERKTKQLIQS